MASLEIWKIVICLVWVQEIRLSDIRRKERSAGCKSKCVVQTCKERPGEFWDKIKTILFLWINIFNPMNPNPVCPSVNYLYHALNKQGDSNRSGTLYSCCNLTNEWDMLPFGNETHLGLHPSSPRSKHGLCISHGQTRGGPDHYLHQAHIYRYN